MKLPPDLTPVLRRARRQRHLRGPCSRRGHPMPALACARHRRSVPVTKSFRVRDVLSCPALTSSLGDDSRDHSLEKLLLLLGLRACTPAEVSRCSSGHCFLARSLMSYRHRRYASLTLIDCPANSSVWPLSMPATHARTSAVSPRAPLTLPLFVRPCVRESLCRAVRSPLPSLHSSCIRALIPLGRVDLLDVRTVKEESASSHHDCLLLLPSADFCERTPLMTSSMS